MLEFVDPPQSPYPLIKALKPYAGLIAGGVLTAAVKYPEMKRAYEQDGIGGTISVASAEALRWIGMGVGSTIGSASSPVVGTVAGAVVGYNATDALIAKHGLDWKESPPGMAAKARNLEHWIEQKSALAGHTARDEAKLAGKNDTDADASFWKKHDEVKKQEYKNLEPTTSSQLLKPEAPASTMPSSLEPELLDKIKKASEARERQQK